MNKKRYLCTSIYLSYKMNGSDFEGYTGIRLENMTYTNDVLLLVVLVLLSVFALIFRLNASLIGKMIGNIDVGKQRQSLFDTTKKDSVLFNAFMIFQTITLSSIYIYALCVKYKYFINQSILFTFTMIGLIFVALFIFYIFKRLIYRFFVNIFTEKSDREMLFVNYQALFCIWGIFLYIPILWILLIGEYLFVAVILFIISYLVFRAMLVYRFIYIFLNKNTGLLFLSSYLCAQEIIPLVFLYEGLIYIYIVETSTIWQ